MKLHENDFLEIHVNSTEQSAVTRDGRQEKLEGYRNLGRNIYDLSMP